MFKQGRLKLHIAPPIFSFERERRRYRVEMCFWVAAWASLQVAGSFGERPVMNALLSEFDIQATGTAK
jgi:hypothetical protein